MTAEAGGEFVRVSTYVYFDGRCREAFALYEAALRGRVTLLLEYAGSGLEEMVPAAWGDKVLHATLEMEGGQRLQGSDAPPGAGARMEGARVSVTVDGVAEAERVFALLAEGGEVTMGLQETFWAARFGMLRDRFGVLWMVASG